MKNILFTLALLFSLLSITESVLADVNNSQQPTTQDSISEQPRDKSLPANKEPYSFLKSDRIKQPSSEASSDALNVSLGLIFILLLIFSLAWFMRKIGYSNISGQGQLKLLATMNLGQKEKIALIQVGKQQLLVGITANQINTLHVLDESLETSEFQGAESGDNSFAKKLSETLANIKVKN